LTELIPDFNSLEPLSNAGLKTGVWPCEKQENPPPFNNGSAIYVMASSGGSWTRITDSDYWTDKPRWSPDGKFVYYVTTKNGFHNIWAIRFDSASGRSVGIAFQVTAFESPSLMFPSSIESSDISLAPGNLAVTLQETSGSVWVLDDVDK